MKRKIHTLGKVCHIVSLILTIVVIAGGVFCLVAGCALCAAPDSALMIEVTGNTQIKVSGDLIDAIPDDALDSFAQSVEYGSAPLTIDGKTVSMIRLTTDGLYLFASGNAGVITLQRLGIVLLSDCLLIGSFAYLLIMLTKLTKKLRTCESPFTADVVKAMTRFGISLIPYAILKPVVRSFAGAFLASGDISVDFRPDLPAVFTVLVFLLLITIFKYGVQLQKEADETP